MSNLQDKTNFELNVLVAMHEHPELAALDGDSIKCGPNDDAMFFVPSSISLDVEGASFCDLKLHNYTGDWAQMGPIIAREGIDLSVNFDGTWLASFADHYTFEEEPAYKHQIKSGLPLRSASICYLMMKGAE